MAILVDEAIWPWRGRKWAHLVTDSHLDELHDFAHRLGMPYLAFQGDHYDIPTEMRLAAIEEGALAVTGRVLVSALIGAGLRQRGGIESWRWEWERTVDASQAADQAADLVAAAGPGLDAAWAGGLGDDIENLAATQTVLTLATASRSFERVLVVSTPVAVDVVRGLTVVDEVTTMHRSVGERGTYIEWRRRRT